MTKRSLPLRYILIGVLNTGFSYSMYSLLIWLGLHFAIANLAATVVGILFSFMTQGRFVFGNSDWGRLRRFVPAWVLLFGLNVTLIAALVSLGLNAYLAGAVALTPTVVASYFVQKHFVFVSAPRRVPENLP